MLIEFVAHAIGVDDEYFLVAPVPRSDDGTDRAVTLQAGP